MYAAREQNGQVKLLVADGDAAREVDVYSKEGFQLLTELWVKSGWQHKISYEPTWLGMPIIQLPQDLLMMQELIYKVRPDVIVETGVAHGGSAIFYASLLELMGKGEVLSIDIEIRKYNRVAIRSHPMSRRVTLIEGSSTDDRTIHEVRRRLQPRDVVLVILDSNHTYAHVRSELDKYCGLVTENSYLVVFDGVMEILADVPGGTPTWDKDNPAAAVRDFLNDHPEFESDPYYNRLGPTYCANGFLRRKRV